jgi:hypothetical protein
MADSKGIMMYAARSKVIDDEGVFVDPTEAGGAPVAAVAARLQPNEDAVVLGLPRGA